ncbi:flavodoxin [candidate division KSB1 bacterium]|nr:MAG: flavodoxin [candidate division KSB1 bacterium]
MSETWGINRNKEIEMLTTLIVCATKHGGTEKCANGPKNRLAGQTELVNLKKSVKIDLNDYVAIIIGGSIHAGQIQKRVKRFCSNRFDLLNQKRIGLFVCCMEEGEKATNQFNEAFPKELMNHASATEENIIEFANQMN